MIFLILELYNIVSRDQECICIQASIYIYLKKQKTFLYIIKIQSAIGSGLFLGVEMDISSYVEFRFQRDE